MDPKATTVLTNLQRGNIEAKIATTAELSFHERCGQGKNYIKKNIQKVIRNCFFRWNRRRGSKANRNQPAGSWESIYAASLELSLRSAKNSRETSQIWSQSQRPRQKPHLTSSSRCLWRSSRSRSSLNLQKCRHQLPRHRRKFLASLFSLRQCTAHHKRANFTRRPRWCLADKWRWKDSLSSGDREQGAFGADGYWEFY